MTTGKVTTARNLELEPMGKTDSHLVTFDHHTVKYVTDLASIHNIPQAELKRLEGVISRYSFRATDYYLNLIDWQDPTLRPYPQADHPS